MLTDGPFVLRPTPDVPVLDPNEVTVIAPRVVYANEYWYETNVSSGFRGSFPGNSSVTFNPSIAADNARSGSADPPNEAHARSIIEAAGGKVNTQVLAAFSEFVYGFDNPSRADSTSVSPAGWTLLQDQNAGDGFYAAAFQSNSTHQVVEVARGTDQLVDVIEDSSALIAPDLKREGHDAVLFADAVQHRVGSATQIALTGHSLGGTLALVMEAETIKDEGAANVRGVVFAPWQATNELSALGLSGIVTPANALDYYIKNDIVGYLKNSPGQVMLLNAWHGQGVVVNGIPYWLPSAGAHGADNYATEAPAGTVF